MGGLIKSVIELNILQVKKVVLQIVLIIILKESELIHLILYYVMIHIKLDVTKNKNYYYYNMFLEKRFT